MPPFEPFSLFGEHVVLEALGPDHVEGLAAASSGDRSTYGWTVVPDGVEEVAAYVEKLLTAAGRGEVVPFVQVDRASGSLIGCTRFMELRWWRGRQWPDEVEIGGTWLAASAQRGPVNTEAKSLLLAHAFDQWDVARVCLCTDARNERSRRAIERIGATFEGVLRNHRPSYVKGEEGRPRDSALFSITDVEWPAVKERLASLAQAVQCDRSSGRNVQ